MNALDTFLETTLRVYWALKDMTMKLKDPPVAALEGRFSQAPMVTEVVEQSLILCEDYVYSRLASAFLPEPDELSPNAVSQPGKVKASWKSRRAPTDVSIDIQKIGRQLELRYPDLYENVSSQMGMPLRSEVAVRRAMISVGDYMFRQSVVTWGRIVGLFAVSAAVATECVGNGRGELVPTVIKVFSELIERHAAVWISRQGGWVAVVKAVRSVKEARYMWILTVLGALSGFAISWSIPTDFF